MFLSLKSPHKQREYWIDAMLSIGDNILKSLSIHSLKKRLPLSDSPDTAIFAPLEAFGRLACGIAPWLEIQSLTGDEEIKRKQRLVYFHEALAAATDPRSPDFMVFNEHKGRRQALVDTAFLCHALLRAPTQITNQIDTCVKNNLLYALRQARDIEPWSNNWLLFGAMIESGLFVLNNEYNPMRIQQFILKIWDWYLGDGVYGDGPVFRFDYYNSYVIQPMLLDIIRLFPGLFPGMLEIAIKRAQRYATVLERLISPKGEYPVIGRSACYRFGAFQLLSQLALQHLLPDTISPAQVRCALTAIIRRILQSSNIFDKDGWLVPGIYGLQPNLAENYINTGSLYLCTTVFLALGLPPNDPFWLMPNEKWSQQRIFNGEDIFADHALI